MEQYHDLFFLKNFFNENQKIYSKHQFSGFGDKELV